MAGGNTPGSAEYSWNSLHRELIEELGPSGVASEIYHSARLIQVFRLPGGEWKGTYEFVLYTAAVDEATFDKWNRCLNTDTVTEGVPEVLTKDQLLGALDNPNTFIGSLDIPVRAYLEQSLGTS